MPKANRLEQEIAVSAVSIAKGQSVGRIPREVVSSDDYVHQAIAEARATGATFKQLRRAVQKGLAGKPNPSLN